MPNVVFHSKLLFYLGSVIGDEISFCKPSAEEMPQEVNDDRNEPREER